MFKKIAKQYLLALIVVWVVPTILYLPSIIRGTIPFWYDPARDMLSAWDNLHKITLIGQPSGIPGIFYGPYWIWLLSLAEIFSKDPRWAAFLVLFIPYIVIGPFVLFGFRKEFGLWTCVLLWLLFIFGFSTYTYYLWNPQLAPLFFLVAIYFLVKKQTLRRVFFAGIFSGLALNIHLSFSTGFIFGAVVFIILSNCILTSGMWTKKIIATVRELTKYIMGIIITFIPFILFETRHNFFQTKTALNAVIHTGGVVAIHGLSKIDILQEFLKSLTSLLHMPSSVGLILVVLLASGIVVVKYKKIVSPQEKRLLLLLICILGCVFGLYMIAKNPIWEYHFTGLEIIYLLLLGIIVSKFKALKYLLTMWVLILFVLQLGDLKNGFGVNPYLASSLITKQYVVILIATDAGNTPYTVIGYNPAIYVYDYSYLFRWMENKSFSYDPGKIQTNTNIVYLIFPGGSSNFDIQNFTSFKTPNSVFHTVNKWNIQDGELIIKREKTT